MAASTVKLEAALLREIRSVKPADQSLAAYVREAVERDLLRRKMRTAAERYRSFLDEHPQEREEQDVWENAPLASPPSRLRG